MDEKFDDLKKDIAAVIDAIKELTKIVAEVNKNVEFLKRAGKF